MFGAKFTLRAAAAAVARAAPGCVAVSGVVGAVAFAHQQQNRNRVSWAHCAAAAPNTECYSWGYGQFGQLGQGDDLDRSLPAVVQDLDNKHGVVAVSHGSSNSSAVLTSGGDLYTFGHGRDGRLAHGWTLQGSPENVPRLVTRLRGKVAQVALGEFHGCCLTKDGTVWTWGKATKRGNMLGHDKEDGFPSPVQGLDGVRVSKVACGRMHTALLTVEGKVMTFGTGKSGQLGHGEPADQKLPRVVEGLEGRTIVDIVCGKEHTLVLTDDNRVFGFGYDQYGQLGQGASSRYQRSPVPVRALDGKKVVKIAAGEHFSLAVCDDGSVFSWGLGLDGQLGHDDTASVSLPKHIQALEGTKIVDAKCGSGHALVLTAEGGLLAFGRGRNGQLGRADRLESVAAYRSTPQRVHFFDGRTIRSFACGANHSLAIVDADTKA